MSFAPLPPCSSFDCPPPSVFCFSQDRQLYMPDDFSHHTRPLSCGSQGAPWSRSLTPSTPALSFRSTSPASSQCGSLPPPPSPLSSASHPCSSASDSSRSSPPTSYTCNNRLPSGRPDAQPRSRVLKLAEDVKSLPSDLDDAWKQHATGEDQAMRCTFHVRWDNGIAGECGFTSRKHATKRHIETTHLDIKRWECDFGGCGKLFTQKASLIRHIALHTGENPYPCKFASCQKAFNDRSRRHKHMVDAHQHVPKPNKKKNAPPGKRT